MNSVHFTGQKQNLDISRGLPTEKKNVWLPYVQVKIKDYTL